MKYIIMKSGFGDYWIGKTRLELPDNAKAFDDFESAREGAMNLCTQCENCDELELINEEEIGEMDNKDMLRWLAK